MMIKLFKKMLKTTSPSKLLSKEIEDNWVRPDTIRCDKKIIVVNGEIICVNANDVPKIMEEMKE